MRRRIAAMARRTAAITLSVVIVGWGTVVVGGRWWFGDGGGGRGRREDVRKIVAESSMPEAEGGVGQCEVMVRTHGLESRRAAHTTIHA